MAHTSAQLSIDEWVNININLISNTLWREVNKKDSVISNDIKSALKIFHNKTVAGHRNKTILYGKISVSGEKNLS